MAKSSLMTISKENHIWLADNQSGESGWISNGEEKCIQFHEKLMTWKISPTFKICDIGIIARIYFKGINIFVFKCG